MNPTALYELVKQAKKENKAVKLLSFNSKEYFIEPEHEVTNKPGNVIHIDGCLIDLNFIMSADIVPNKECRLLELKELEKKIKEEMGGLGL